MFEKSFIDACLLGEVSLDAIDDYIEAWHTQDIDVDIETFLGMTPYEYKEWLKCGEDIILRDILAAREEGVSYEKYKDMSEESRIAARSFNEDVISKLKNEEKKE